MTEYYIEDLILYNDITRLLGRFCLEYDEQNERIISLRWTPHMNNRADAPAYPLTILPETMQIARFNFLFTPDNLNDYYNNGDDICEDTTFSIDTTAFVLD